MGLEIRRVPAGWVHPVDGNGDPIPLEYGDVVAKQRDWDIHAKMYQLGFVESITRRAEFREAGTIFANALYDDFVIWEPINDSGTFAEYHGERPELSQFMGAASGAKTNSLTIKRTTR